MDSSGMRLIEPTFLYNLLNQETIYPCLSDPVFMLILDVRDRSDYNEGHILTARLVHVDSEGEFMIPYDADIECRTHVVVYDGCTESLDRKGAAVRCAAKLWELGSRNEVKILKGGYERFSALYPFLRRRQIFYLQPELDELETYPTEVIPELLYLGRLKHGNSPYVQRDLKIKAHVACCSQSASFYRAKGDDVYRLKIEDESSEDLYSHLNQICTFIDKHVRAEEAVLVYSDLGIGRSVSVIIAYLLFTQHCDTFEEAFKLTPSLRPTACPNEGFKKQLIKWLKSMSKERDVPSPYPPKSHSPEHLGDDDTSSNSDQSLEHPASDHPLQQAEHFQTEQTLRHSNVDGLTSQPDQPPELTA